MMTAPELKQNRLDWVGGNLQVAEKVRLPISWAAPYFDVFFAGIEVDTWPSPGTASGS